MEKMIYGICIEEDEEFGGGVGVAQNNHEDALYDGIDFKGTCYPHTFEVGDMSKSELERVENGECVVVTELEGLKYFIANNKQALVEKVNYILKDFNEGGKEVVLLKEFVEVA